MRHNKIPRFIALLLVLALIVLCILLAQPVSAVECRLYGKPEPQPWQPEDSDIAYISRTVWGECRGCCLEEQIGQAWNILCRVSDPRFPDTVAEVVSAPNQYQGYSANNPAEPFWELANQVLIEWHSGKWGIPPSMCWCSGDGKHQRFRDSWLITEETRYYP